MQPKKKSSKKRRPPISIDTFKNALKESGAIMALGVRVDFAGGMDMRQCPEWVGPVLRYVNNHCFQSFQTLKEADQWLTANPDHWLNQKAIRSLIAC